MFFCPLLYVIIHLYRTTKNSFFRGIRNGMTLTQFIRRFVRFNRCKANSSPSVGKGLSSHLTRTCVSGCVPTLLVTHTAPHQLIQRQACHGEDGRERRLWMGLQWPATHFQKERNPGWENRFLWRHERIGSFCPGGWLDLGLRWTFVLIVMLFSSPWPQPIYEMVAGRTCSLTLALLRVHRVGWTRKVLFCWDGFTTNWKFSIDY